MSFHRVIFFAAFVFAVQNGFAQGGSTIKASVDRNKILIGEPVQLTVEAKLSSQSIISFVSIDTIEHFELLEKPIIDTVTSNGSTTIKGVYKIISFDSGHWVIPSFALSPGGIKTDTIPIDVVFSDFDPTQEYHDIKDILEVKASTNKIKWWWYAGAAVLLLAILLYYLTRKKKSVSVSIPKVTINPYDEAMKQLEQLQREKPEAKQYYSRLTYIFRLYVFRRKGILSLQKTTDDMVLQLQSLNMDKQQFDKLAQSLRLSDFVKFAKYIPSSDDDKTCYEEIKKSIMTLEQSESKASV